MKKEINPIVTIVVIVVMVAAIVGGYAYFGSAHAPGGVHYTPGVPPWKEKGGAGYKPTPDYPAPGPNQPPASGNPAQPPFAPPAIGSK